MPVHIPTPQAIPAPRTRPPRHARRRGQNMMSDMLSLIVTGLVIVAVLGIGAIVLSSTRAGVAVTEITLIAQKTQNLLGGAVGRYGAADFTKGAIASGVFPKTNVVGAGASRTAVNAFGGPITLKGDGMTFTITYGDVPAEACVEIATRIGSSQGAGLQEIKVGGTAVTIPVSSTDALAACTDKDGAKTFVFKMS